MHRQDAKCAEFHSIYLPAPAAPLRRSCCPEQRFIAELAAMQFGVQPAAREQFFVCAALDDSPLIEHQHQIGLVHGRETVGNDVTGAATLQSTQLDASSRIRMRGSARIARAIPIT